MTRFIRDFVAPVVLMGLLWAVPACAQVQGTIREREISAEPIPPALSTAYEPCAWNGVGAGIMCLSDRKERVSQLRRARFDGEQGTCRLLYPEEDAPEVFGCGVLLLGLRKDRTEQDLSEILEASDGEWASIETRPLLLWDSARLRVAPGTERQALVNIIFHPSILWIRFDYVRIGIFRTPGSQMCEGPEPQRHDKAE